MKKVPSGILPLIVVDRKSGTPLHRQIYEALRTGIVQGNLRPRQRIPSSRTLAIELGVSRFPVLNAYAQLLAEGYLESRVGAGTAVCGSLPEQFMSSRPPSRTTPAGSSARRSSAPKPSIASQATILRPPWLRGWGAFGVGQIAVEEFPTQIWSKLVTRRARNTDVRFLHYGDRMGSKHLRETLAEYLRASRSLRCEADQIMIVNGSQQALAIAAHVLLKPGAEVCFEEPGYPFARDAFLMTGCRVVPIPVDNEGLNVAMAARKYSAARVAFVTPSHQFPLGVTMSAARRLRLLSWANETASWIIEDDYDSEFRYDGSPVASMQGLDTNSRVIYVGTFSKVLFPGLRMGYMVLPSSLVDRFAATRWATDLGPPTFFQDVVADFIDEGHFARHLRRMRMTYRERRTVLVENVRKELGTRVEILGSDAGMHLTVTLPARLRDTEIAERAARQNLWLWPLSSAYFGKRTRSGFILGFGSVSTAEIPRAVQKLARLLDGKQSQT
jgi:GntR family transcriptional regulator/MocR family aminotransferase